MWTVDTTTHFEHTHTDTHVAKYFFFFFSPFPFLKIKTASWNPDGMGWRLMPEVLRQPFLKQGATTKKFAFRSAMICGVVSSVFLEK